MRAGTRARRTAIGFGSPSRRRRHPRPDPYWCSSTACRSTDGGSEREAMNLGRDVPGGHGSLWNGHGKHVGKRAILDACAARPAQAEIAADDAFGDVPRLTAVHGLAEPSEWCGESNGHGLTR